MTQADHEVRAFEALLGTLHEVGRLDMGLLTADLQAPDAVQALHILERQVRMALARAAQWRQEVMGEIGRLEERLAEAWPAGPAEALLAALARHRLSLARLDEALRPAIARARELRRRCGRETSCPSQAPAAGSNDSVSTRFPRPQPEDEAPAPPGPQDADGGRNAQ